MGNISHIHKPSGKRSGNNNPRLPSSANAKHPKKAIKNISFPGAHSKHANKFFFICLNVRTNFNHFHLFTWQFGKNLSTFQILGSFLSTVMMTEKLKIIKEYKRVRSKREMSSTCSVLFFHQSLAATSPTLGFILLCNRLLIVFR